MTARERIRAKPETVQVVLKVMVTRASLHDPEPDFEQLTNAALLCWEVLVADYRKENGPISEAALAEQIVDRLRKQDVWGKILRGNAQ